MRGLVALCMMLATAAFSGCVELVDPEAAPDEATVQQVAAEAERAIDEYQEEKGHIAGTVLDPDGKPFAGALVDLEGVATDVPTDDAGRFTFIDLDPRVYTVTFEAAKHVPAQLQVEVLAGQFARPQVVLAAAVPEAYFTTFRFDGYAQLTSVGVYGTCYCDFDGPLDVEGLTEVLVEAEMGPQGMPLSRPDSFVWDLLFWDSEGSHHETGHAGGYEQAPMRVLVPGNTSTAPSDHFSLHVSPDWTLVPSMGQSFAAYLTAFYNGPAPEDFTAIGLVE